jgi:hypothetical protein
MASCYAKHCGVSIPFSDRTVRSSGGEAVRWLRWFCACFRAHRNLSATRVPALHLNIVLVVVLVLVLDPPLLRGRGPFASLTEDEDDSVPTSLHPSFRRTVQICLSAKRDRQHLLVRLSLFLPWNVGRSWLRV